MKKTCKYAGVGLVAILLTACGGGGGGSAPPPSKAVTKAYLFCAMSSNSKIVSVESSLNLPSGYTVSYQTPAIGDSLTTYLLSNSAITAPLFANDSISGTFDTTTRTLKYTLLLTSVPTFQNISSNKKGSGREIASFSFPFETAGVVPATTIPVSDSAPVIGKEKSGNRDYLNGCVINYVTTNQ